MAPHHPTLLLAGLNHRTAPVSLRESMAFDRAGAEAALKRWKTDYPRTEAVLLSTCNRVELYVAGEEAVAVPAPERLGEFLAAGRGVAWQHLAGHLYQYDRAQVAEHLFRVAASLDSLVIGETQILAQVKQAYQTACAAGTVGTILHALFQRAFAAAKEIHEATRLSGGHVSVASVAVAMLRDVFDRFDDKTVLVIGAGKMAELFLPPLQELAPHRVLVTNRSPERAAQLAAARGLAAAPFESLADLLTAADIVLTSTAAGQPIITAEAMKGVLKRRHYRPLVMVDIAVPRDIEAAVGRMTNVYLYNIDSLQHAAQENLKQRGAQVQACRQIVDQHARQFAQWFVSRDTGPLVQALYEHCRQIGHDQVEELLSAHPELTAEQREAIRKMSHRIVSKILHLPVTELAASSSQPRQMHLAQAIQQLFRLAPRQRMRDEGGRRKDEEGADEFNRQAAVLEVKRFLRD